MGQLNNLMKEIHEIAISKGWWETERDFGEIIALMHTELSEAYEEYRNHKENIYYSEGNKPEGIAIELIDVIIRILDYFGRQGWDIEELIKIKMDYNKTRSYRHGNKKA